MCLKFFHQSNHDNLFSWLLSDIPLFLELISASGLNVGWFRWYYFSLYRHDGIFLVNFVNNSDNFDIVLLVDFIDLEKIN